MLMKILLMVASPASLAIILSCAALAADDQLTIEKAQEFLRMAAEAQRQLVKDLTFEEFEVTVYKEPFKNGKYIVNGDTPIRNRKLLREFYERNIKNPPASPDDGPVEFIVHIVGGLDAVWSDSEKRALTYCVSEDFEGHHTHVVAAMEAASKAWEAVADINFIHVAGEDGRCTADNTNVVFDVRPVQVFGNYLARAFFPNDPRSMRNILIDESSFTLAPSGTLQLVGILRHELGHTIGARHEHTRPESGTCFEDKNWRPLTDYDPFSVMHYPQCNGFGDWSLRLTDKDKSGVACLYGSAPGFTVDPDICQALKRNKTTTVVLESQNVGRGDKNDYGPYSVKPGTSFRAVIEASDSRGGDPDLYVRFDGHPLLTEYDCRPYTAGADEKCTVDVPAGKSAAGVMVHGFDTGHYTLTITHTEP